MCLFVPRLKSCSRALTRCSSSLIVTIVHSNVLSFEISLGTIGILEVSPGQILFITLVIQSRILSFLLCGIIL